jgi:hypothetical protein
MAMPPIVVRSAQITAGVQVSVGARIALSPTADTSEKPIQTVITVTYAGIFSVRNKG